MAKTNVCFPSPVRSSRLIQKVKAHKQSNVYCGPWQLMTKHFFKNRSFAHMYIFEEGNLRNSCNAFPHSRDSRPGFQPVHLPPSVRSLFIVRVGCFEPFTDFSSDMIQFWTFSLQQIPSSNHNSLELEFWYTSIKN